MKVVTIINQNKIEQIAFWPCDHEGIEQAVESARSAGAKEIYVDHEVDIDFLRRENMNLAE